MPQGKLDPAVVADVQRLLDYEEQVYRVWRRRWGVPTPVRRQILALAFLARTAPKVMPERLRPEAVALRIARHHPHEHMGLSRTRRTPPAAKRCRSTVGLCIPTYEVVTFFNTKIPRLSDAVSWREAGRG